MTTRFAYRIALRFAFGFALILMYEAMFDKLQFVAASEGCPVQSQRQTEVCRTLLRSAYQNPPTSSPKPTPTITENETKADAASPSGDITGRVMDEDGKPIFNAMVYATVLNRVNPMARRTITDPEGRFRLAALTPGTYSLSATAAGYVQSTLEDERREQVYYRIGDHAALTLNKGGVITGKVTDANGYPITTTTIHPIRVRDANGKLMPPALFNASRRATDDRGIYRLFGLAPGTYLVMVAGSSNEAPIFHPSSTRDTAMEVTVRSGEEASGIDIRFRSEPGRVVSGKVLSGDGRSRFGAAVRLYYAGTGTLVGLTEARFTQGRDGFEFWGVPDGEYEVIAWLETDDHAEEFISLPRRVSVKGANVTGIEIALTRLGAFSGRVMLEAATAGSAAAACASKRTAQPAENIITARRADQVANESGLLEQWSTAFDMPNERSEFALKNLIAAHYRVETRLPGESWYVKSITAPHPASARQTLDAGRSGLTLRAGEKAKGITVVITEGAASVRGRLTPASESAKLPARLRVHLIPAERERVDDVLHYAQANANSDGSFTLTNLAPGKYWMLARVIPDDEANEAAPRPEVWDNNERAKLRREAEAAKIEIELQPCQRVSDYALRYAPSTNK